MEMLNQSQAAVSTSFETGKSSYLGKKHFSLKDQTNQKKNALIKNMEQSKNPY